MGGAVDDFNSTLGSFYFTIKQDTELKGLRCKGPVNCNQVSYPFINRKGGRKRFWISLRVTNNHSSFTVERFCRRTSNSPLQMTPTTDSTSPTVGRGRTLLVADVWLRVGARGRYTMRNFVTKDFLQGTLYSTYCTGVPFFLRCFCFVLWQDTGVFKLRCHKSPVTHGIMKGQ